MSENAQTEKIKETPKSMFCDPARERNGTIYKAGLIAGNTAAGWGLGVAAGIGTVIAASIAEVAVPAFLVLKVFGVTGGALGFLRGVKKQ